MSVFAVVMFLPEPLIPAVGLDYSWVLAAEHAAQRHLLFGQDFVFTYGPFAFLTTHLYDAATYGWVLADELFLTTLYLAPLILFSRRPAVLFLYFGSLLLGPLAFDTRVVVALLVLFLASLGKKGRWVVAAAALFAPLALSKYSFAVAALPLFMLTDLYGWATRRRLPLVTGAFIIAILVLIAAAGQPMAALPTLVWNNLQVVQGYSQAMQIQFGKLYPLAIGVVFTGSYMAALAWLGWRRAAGDRLKWAIALAGIGWVLLVIFKMGYVRQDAHIFNMWHGMMLVTPVLAAWIDCERRLDRLEVGGFALAGATSLLATLVISFLILRLTTEPMLGPVTYAGRVAQRSMMQPFRAMAWATPARWHEATHARATAQRALARPFPISVRGTVDAVPSDLTDLIASGLRYRPRPVPQSYSSYTPALQRLDQRHFADPSTAPDTLLLKIGPDIDKRLPTLATGPSLPEIGRWYDAIDVDRSGLVLRHRNVPRKVQVAKQATRDFQLGEWVALPHRNGAMTLAAIDLHRSLSGGIVNFLLRDPMLLITLRDTAGREHAFRFIPGMAQVGVVLSPVMNRADLTNWRGAAAMFEPVFAPDDVAEVVAFRITGGTGGWLTFGRGAVTTRLVSLAPGFTRALRSQNLSTTPE